MRRSTTERSIFASDKDVYHSDGSGVRRPGDGVQYAGRRRTEYHQVAR